MKVAVVQAAAVMFDTAATMVRVEGYCREAAAAGARLVVFPEAMIGGYPKGLSFGAVVGSRSAEGREMFLRYSKAAIAVPGVETEMLAGWAKELQLHIVVGVVERDGGTLYCTGLVFTPGDGLVLKHRKLMPTGSERLIWGQATGRQGDGVNGEGTGLRVIETELGRIGVAICWENYMPMYRQHLYEQKAQLWCAPTVDMREVWGVSMRHIAYEGRCFVLSACQWMTKEDWPTELREEGGEIGGGSLMVSPIGEVLAGPMKGVGVIYAEIDLDDISRGKYDLDVAGHYGRRDLFELKVRD